MIIGFLITNEDGELLFFKATSSCSGRMNKGAFLRHVKQNILTLECLIKLENNYFLCVKENNLRIAICFESTATSPLFISYKIQRCIKLCADFIGEFNESNVLQNIGMVCDIFTDVLENCEVNAKNYAAIWDSKATDTSLLSMLPTNLFGSKSIDPDLVASSDSSKRSILQSKKDINEADGLFVDLMEEIKLVINDTGATLHSSITGKMLIKSYSSQAVSLLVSFSDNLKCDDDNQSELFSTDTMISHCQFQNRVDKKDFPKSLKVTANQGSNPVFSYGIKIMSLKLPFTMYSSTSVESRSMISLNLKFHCNADVTCAPINFQASMPLPSNTVSLSAKSSLHSIKFVHSTQESKLYWTSDMIAGQSHHSIAITISVSEITNLTLLELSSVNLCFEIPSICLSGLHITNVKIQNNLAKPIKKWARCLAFTKNYQFLLNHQGA